MARTRALVAVLALAAAVSPAVGPPAGRAGAQQAAVTRADGAATPLAGYLIQSSATAGDDGAAISTPGFPATGWLPAAPRSTVFAALLQNGRYPDPFYSTNMRQANVNDFKVPWWYRSDFTVADTMQRTQLDFAGVLSRADVWVNGTRVATSAQVAGAYPRHDLDITSLVRAGTNSVAFKIFPNDPARDLTIGWIDWVQNPPDRNMGIFRDVLVRRSGAVALRNATALPKLTAALDRADITVKVDARNDSASPVTASITATIGEITVAQSVSLAARETKTVAFTPAAYPQLGVGQPRIWWPAGHGAQPLYDLSVTATVNGVASDSAARRFGIRDIKAPLDASGHREYRVNGRRILISGGGWQSDLFFRWDNRVMEDKIRATLDMGLNTIRLEGHLPPEEFFEMTDRLGMLVLPGWECCDKWEGNNNGGEPGDPWSSADFAVAKASMFAEAVRMRDHPSVISFLIGSDFAPQGNVETTYLDALRAADWPLPIISSASTRGSPVTGSSGMKMHGPYDWVPPVYWYNKRSGGAYGFASEISAGPSVPTMDTLRRMLSPTELNTLWQSPSAVQYHRSPSSTFNTLRIFNNALTGRFGAPSSLPDYVKKAQLQQYENVRAQFEAFRRNFSDSSNPSTGHIYWMLNGGWTSLHWQLFDAYLDQNGSYYGAKKANEPVHIQYSHDNRSVVVVNSTPTGASGLTARVQLYNIDGTEKFAQTVPGINVGAGGKTTALTVPAVSGLTTTYLARLLLTDNAGKEVSRNVYWLSTSNDVINWSGEQWYYAPTSSYANLKGLSSLASAPVCGTATTSADPSGTSTTTVTLRNTGTGKAPALYLDAHLMGAGDRPALPVTWSDNAVSLWPGEQVTLTATYRTAALGGAAPSVRVAGWNSPTVTLPGDCTTPPPASRYEAEAATITQGVVESNHAGFTGTGFVNYDNVVGSAVEFTATVATAGTYALTFRFANGTTSNRPMDIALNGVLVSDELAFPGTGAWPNWQEKTITVSLPAGSSKIKATATTANGGPNLDHLDLAASG